MSHHLNNTMGITLCTAGGWAYYSKKSLPSLIASCTFGAAYFASAALIKSNQNPQLGHDIATVTSGLLALTMGTRVVKSQSWRQPLNVAMFMTISGTAVGGYNLNKSMTYREPVELDIDEKELAKSIGTSSS
eukprot:121923_1